METEPELDMDIQPQGELDGDPVLVVLAAGASERLGRCKALVALRAAAPATPLALLLTNGRAVAMGRRPEVPLVVTGLHHPAICAAIAAEPSLAPCEVVENSTWRRGRTGSVRRALEARPDRDLCLAPVDVPLVPVEVFAALGVAWRAAGSPPRGWLAPAWIDGRGERRHGHPVVLGRRLLAEGLAALADGAPLRGLRATADPVWDLQVASAAILDDLDTPADLEALERRLRRSP